MSVRSGRQWCASASVALPVPRSAEPALASELRKRGWCACVCVGGCVPRVCCRPRFKAPRILNTSPSQSPSRRRPVGAGGYWPGPDSSNLPLAGSLGGSPPPAALGGVYGVGLRISVVCPACLACALAGAPCALLPLTRMPPCQERAPYFVETVNELMDEHDRVLVGSVAPGDELVAVDNAMLANLPLPQVRSPSTRKGGVGARVLSAPAPKNLCSARRDKLHGALCRTHRMPAKAA